MGAVRESHAGRGFQAGGLRRSPAGGPDRLLLVVEQRFHRTPDGAVWTPVDTASYGAWSRYRRVFPEVCLFARVRNVPKTDPTWLRVDGEGVNVMSAPHYVGPAQFALKACAVAHSAWRATRPHSAAILRGPGMLSSCVRVFLRLRGRPYGLQVLGNSSEVFAPGVVRHRLRRLFRWLFARELRRMCAEASTVAYVTRAQLQRQFPPSRGAFATWFSDVILPPEAFVKTARCFSEGQRFQKVVFVGSMEQLYKGPDVLVEACLRCKQGGTPVQLTMVGDGKHRRDLEELCSAEGLRDSVQFTGWVSDRAELWRLLDSSDLFALPSRTEGLPRALIEAMARALPCIGTNVGGIPELLEHDELVSPSDGAGLAAKIREILENPRRMSAMSSRNLEKAAAFRWQAMLERSLEFYQYLKAATIRRQCTGVTR